MLFNIFKIFVFIFLMLIKISLSGEISGNISGILTKENSPYNVIGDLIIPENDSLKIEAGVYLIFKGQFNLISKGKIIINGVENDSVKFISDNTISNWGKIRIEGKNNFIQYAFLKNSFRGIEILNDSTKIINCFIDKTLDTGIDIIADYVEIKNTKIYNCKKNAIKISYKDSVKIKECELKFNGIQSGYPALMITDSSPLIEDNIISNNFSQGIGVWRMNKDCNPKVKNNIIEKNFTGIALIGGSGWYEGNIVRNNYQEGNSNSGAGFYIGYSTATPNILRNIITGNYCGIYIINSANPILGNININMPTGNNVIKNNIYQSSVFDIYNNSGNTIYAQMNYWGTNDSLTIQSHIINQSGNVIFSPFNVENNINLDYTNNFYCFASPNPFNLSTTITYNLNNNEFINLSIYNIKGELVKNLINEYKINGKYSILWDGKDNSGKSVGSGIYFYKLKAGEKEITNKMILLK